jgi:cobalt/nickel transport system permease protein
MRLLDRVAQTNRWRHVPTAEKLMAAVAALLACLLSPSPLVQAAVLVLMAGMTIGGTGCRARDWLKAAALPLAFVLTGTLAQMLTLDFSGGLPVIGMADPASVRQALFFLLRGTACISALLFLALTTPLTALIQWSERRGLNPDIADIALLMFRMIWLTLDALERGENALKNRLGHRTYRGMLRSHGLLLAALLPRVFAHARRLDGGLAARGYEGRLIFLTEERLARPARLFAIALGFTALLGLGLVT